MKKHTEHKHPNRRKFQDRRGEELGPPGGWRERRLSVERRLPVVQENVISEAEWFKRLAHFITKKRAAEKAQHDASAASQDDVLPPS
ncbi:MAG TPA: hypothetical protein VLA64_06380 [Azonexus sp.]|nr:hypothetical protein [Azonexus sp.]